MVRARKGFLLGFLYGSIFVLVFTQYTSGPRNVLNPTKGPIKETSTTRSRAKRQWNHSVARDHPHAGARDENGAWNYVPDVEAIRRTVLQRIQNDPDSTDPIHYLPLDANTSAVCQEAPGQGFEQPEGYKVLREYVELDGPDPLPEEHAPEGGEHWLSTRHGHFQRYPHGTPFNRSRESPPRILCGVYTHEGSHDKLADIVDTWGWRCDGFFAASTKTNRSIGAVDLPHFGTEEYGNMWQKTRSMVSFMYDYYLEDYDYFLLSGDDTFVILENLRNYLLLLESETGGRDAQPLFIGQPFSLWYVYYNTGGPSYLLNRLALRRLVEDALPHFFADTITSGEDAVMGAIMSVLHIPLVDTSDAAHRQRFFHDALDVVGSETKPWLYDALMYSHGNRKGKNVVSTQSIGFHKITSMKRFSAILYNACPKGTVLGDAQKSTLHRPGQSSAGR
jgi:hypothetical protein